MNTSDRIPDMPNSNDLNFEDIASELFLEATGNDGVFAGLAVLPSRAILTEPALAKMLGVCPRTIRRMVERFELSPPFEIANRSCWFAGKVLDWLEAAAERKAREAEKLAKRFWENN